MVDAVVEDGPLERLDDMVLTDDLIEGLRAVTPIEGQRRFERIVVRTAVEDVDVGVLHGQLLNPFDGVGIVDVTLVLVGLQTVGLVGSLRTVQQTRITRIRGKVVVRGGFVRGHDGARRLLVAEKIRTVLFEGLRLDDLVLHARLGHPLIHGKNPS